MGNFDVSGNGYQTQGSSIFEELKSLQTKALPTYRLHWACCQSSTSHMLQARYIQISNYYIDLTRYSSSGDSAKSPEGPPPADEAVVDTVWRSMSEMRQSPLLALKVADLKKWENKRFDIFDFFIF